MKHRDATEALDHSDDTQSGCVLYVSDGPEEDRGQAVQLPKGRAILGSDEKCDLVLHDSSVSRQHTQVSIVEGGIEVEDLNSTNGTFSRGQRVHKVMLRYGSRLTLGRCNIDILPLTGSKGAPVSSRDGYGGLIGSSMPLRRLYAFMERLENSDAPVLIHGESGTGKELCARAIHDHSARAKKPYVVIDCANMQRDLVRSEIFGHSEGSFTGADRDKPGAFEVANGGTVFLDEIGELQLELQPNLLRVLETGQIQRVGESKPRNVNVRVIAATHRNLAEQVEAGKFRQDLFYRLAVVQLTLPSLREIIEDIPRIAHHFAKDLSSGRISELPESVTQLMMGYAWPGNVRELRNAVHRLLSLGTLGIAGDMEEPVWLEPTPTDSRSQPNAGKDLGDYKKARENALSEFESAYLNDLLAQNDGNISAAAKEAGIDRKHLRDLLKRHGLYKG